MRGSVRARATVVVALLGVLTGTGCSVVPRDVAILQASASDIDATVELAVDSCNADVSASAEEDDDRVEVTVRARNVTRDDCADGVTLQLAAPLGGRELVDAATGEVVAVGDADTGVPAPEPDRPPAPAEALVDRTHVLVSVDGDPAVSIGEDAPRLRLRSDLSFVVSGGCNHRVGSYEIDADGLYLGPDPVDTVRRCRDDVIGTQERRVFRVLSSSAEVMVDGTVVTISDGSDELVYELLSDAPDVDLAGAAWRLDAIEDGDEEVPVTAAAALELDDGVLRAETGCNVIAGEAIVLGDEIRFPVGAGATEIECDVDAQEDAVLGVFSAEAVTAQLDGDQLTVTAGETSLRYRRIGA